MKKLMYLIFLVLFTSTLIACATPTATATATPTIKLVGPGDKIGAMTVEQGTQDASPTIGEFCQFLPEEPEPATITSDCFVPIGSGQLTLMTGWGAIATKLASNWEDMVWELYIDDYQVDLEKFDLTEIDGTYSRTATKMNHWYILLNDLSLGEHTFRFSWSSEVPIDDGFMVYQPGTYEYITNFTVYEPEDYLTLSATVNAGEHRFNSEAAGLDYLLYLPDEYDADSQEKWPLLLYLHGTIPGSGLDSMKLGSDIGEIVEQGNGRFLIAAPRGEGQYEFWATDEMLASLDSLLEEIQGALSVDAQRIYLAGTSSGGNGAWVLGLHDPERFAALVSMMGSYGWPFTVPENMCDLKNVPVWAFHGADDDVVPLDAEQMLVNALEDCGGDVQFTVYPDIGHDISDQVYANPELYDWLLSHSLE